MGAVVLGMGDLDAGLEKLKGVATRGGAIAAAAAGAVMKQAWRDEIIARRLIDSGNMLRHVNSMQEGAEVMVYNDATRDEGKDSPFPYPLALEYGTRKMRARPHMRPAFDKGVAPAVQAAKDAYEELLGDAFA